MHNQMEILKAECEEANQNRRDGEGRGARRPAGHGVGGHARGASELLKSALSPLYQRTALEPNHNRTQRAHIQVNKLIGDLHKQFLQQGSNKVILAFSLPFSIVSAKEALENVNLWCVSLRSSEHSNPDH